MTNKEYLMQYRICQQELRCLDVEIEELWTRLTSTGGASDGMPKKPTREETHTRLHAVMADKLQEKKKKREHAEEIMADIIEVIDSVADPVYRQLLFERYIQCKDWAVIAIDLHYESEEYVRGELHGKALNSVHYIMP